MEPGEIVRAFAAGAYDEISTSIASAVSPGLPTSELERVWRAITDSLGELVGTQPGFVLHDLALTFERGEAHLQIALRDDSIVGLVLRPGRPTGRFGE